MRRFGKISRKPGTGSRRKKWYRQLPAKYIFTFLQAKPQPDYAKRLSVGALAFLQIIMYNETVRNSIPAPEKEES